jgi:hypothetical protein
MVKWVKPTVDTKFHIDFDWWEEAGRNFRVHLLEHLCDDCQERYADYQDAELIDWIDAETAEVTRVDGLWHSLLVCCSSKPDYVSDYTPLATAVFRTFLANGNEPLTPNELEERLGRPAETILRTIGGFRVYSGIKPVEDKRIQQG